MVSNWIEADSPDFAQTYVRKSSRWPQLWTLGITVAACLVAGFRMLVPSLVAYCVVLLGGSTLIFADRVREVVKSRDPVCQWIPVDRAWKRAALLAMMVGCLLNGVVVAWLVATR